MCLCVASSVKHKYDGNWDNKNIKLTTCNPNDKEFNKHQDPQEVVADEELIFTYDVKFVVRIFPVFLACYL
jgi:transmembrane 9 superfamily protein 2/4